MFNYSHPEALVNTQWVADHLDDSNVRLLEVGWDRDNHGTLHRFPG